MRPSLPALILSAFVAVAIAILVTGGLLAQRETIERTERDRGSHEQLAAELREELQRLDALYERHLKDLLSRAQNDTGPGFIAACKNVVGLRHFSRLSPKSAGIRELQVDIRVPGAASVPIPVLSGTAPMNGFSRRELHPDQLFGNKAEGWLREPGRPSLFIMPSSGSAADVLTIDDAEVCSVIDRWLSTWLREPFGRVAPGEDRIVGPSKKPLAESTPASGAPPDWVLPIRAAFGTWRIESWDPRFVRREWNVPVLAGTMGLATAVLLAGVSLAARVRRERFLAEQRVSFVNRVSHELRTPLTNILLNLDVAADALEDDAEPSRRLGLAREEARRLGRLIENVLTFSRKERDAIEPSPRACMPAAVIQDILDQFGPALRRREIVIEAALDNTRACFLDADALAQITANLFSNLEKYVPAGAVALQLRLELAELILTVADKGPGVPDEAADRIFLPYERLNDRTTAGVTGTGLGLAIARELAHKMGGTLKLLPSSMGAVFELRVPAPAVPDLRATSAA